MSIKNNRFMKFHQKITLFAFAFYSFANFSAPKDHAVDSGANNQKCIISISKISKMIESLNSLESTSHGTSIRLRTINGEEYAGRFVKYYRPMKDGRPDLSKAMEIRMSVNGQNVDIPTSAIYAEEGQLVIGGNAATVQLPRPTKMSPIITAQAQAKMTLIPRTTNEYYVDLDDLVPSQNSASYSFTGGGNIQQTGEQLVGKMDQKLAQAGLSVNTTPTPQQYKAAASEAIKTTVSEALDVIIIDGQIVSFSNRRPTSYQLYLGGHNPQVRVRLLDGEAALNEFRKGKLTTEGTGFQRIPINGAPDGLTPTKSRYVAAAEARAARSPDAQISSALNNYDKPRNFNALKKMKTGEVTLPDRIINDGRSKLMQLYAVDGGPSLETAVDDMTKIMEKHLKRFNRQLHSESLVNEYKRQILNIEDSVFRQKISSLTQANSPDMIGFKALIEDLKYLGKSHPERAQSIAAQVADDLSEIANSRSNFEIAWELFESF